jgi:hypothetical protein
MTNKQISSELKRYFYEMKNDATSHDKVALLVTIAILVGCGYGTYGNLIASMQSSKGLVLLIGITLIVTIWLVGFALGVLFRTDWTYVFPPYRMIGAATVPAFIIAVATGSIAGKYLFKTPVLESSGGAFGGYLTILIVMHFLFLLHAPLTRKTVQLNHNPNITIVDSHRYMWLFPALGVLILYLVSKKVAPEESRALYHVAVTSGIVVSTIFAGFGAGYIP